ncbi:MAG: phosphotransferase [Desulfosarcina sp.]|nr:phosphotransferase [Desulfobacterales bacterium]
MINFSGIQKNFNFLLTEVIGQANDTFIYLNTFEEQLFDKIVSRDDYIDNLKSTIENDCFSVIYCSKETEQTAINLIRSTNIITVNLERIADFSVNIAHQVAFLRDRSLWLSFDFIKMCDIIVASLKQIASAALNKNLGDALRICKSEFELDQLYKEHFKRIMNELRQGKKIETFITILFIFRYLERIGDSLLNIGEAILFAILGEKIKIKQFEALQQTLAKSQINLPFESLKFHSFWGTRSGCNITKVAPAGIKKGQESIFKTGNSAKIKKEKASIEKWTGIMPGLVPNIFSFHEEDEYNASLLIEFMYGQTMDEIILTAGWEVLENAIFHLKQILLQIWQKTKTPGNVGANYMGQLLARLNTIGRVHPEYIRNNKQLGSLSVESTNRLVRKCQLVEQLLLAPFSILIHGDFNTNNILFDNENKQIHFIDLYRSRETDLLQDISVIIISNFRMPVFDSPIRERINYVIGSILSFTREFCEKEGDTTFDARLTLALARSFLTSTRFELNDTFAREMALRSNFLMEKIICFHETKRPWPEFNLPEAILYY